MIGHRASFRLGAPRDRGGSPSLMPQAWPGNAFLPSGRLQPGRVVHRGSEP